jgi:hypothetical protein
MYNILYIDATHTSDVDSKEGDLGASWVKIAITTTQRDLRLGKSGTGF